MTDSKSNGASAGMLAEAYQFSSNESDQGNDKSSDGSNYLNDQSADGSSFGNDRNGDNRNNGDNDGNGDNRDNGDNDGNGDNRQNDSRDQSNQGNEYSSNGDDGNDRNNDNSDRSNQGNDNSDRSNQGNDYADKSNQGNDYSDQSNQNNEYSSDGDDGSDRNNDNSDNSNQNNEYSSNGDDGNVVDTDIGVTLTDAFNDKSTSYKDSFNSDDDAIDVSALCAQLEDVVGTIGGDALSAEGGQALFGDGNVFSIEQIATLQDQDAVHQPNVSLEMQPGSQYSLNASGVYGGGGTSAQQNGTNSATDSAEITAGANATADALAGHESLTMSLSLGANTQFTSVDMSVVGGDASGADFGDA